MVKSGPVQPPVFSIGVTTYNRKELLKQTINSILNQTFTEFEVIVGNDYIEEALTGEQLGIDDRRVRFINHSKNLKEIGNMNELLRLANGKYFTWLADDDLYHPKFLAVIYEVLNDYDFPSAVFSSFAFIRGNNFPSFPPIAELQKKILSKQQFFHMGLDRNPQIMATNGVFDVNFLRRIGGLETLCDSGVGLYAEYIFLVKCALLETIAYVDTPLVLYRLHSGSWGQNNIELGKYIVAGPELIRRSAEVLRHPALKDDFDDNLIAICKLHLSAFTGKSVAIEIADKKFGVGAAYRSYSRFLEEVNKTIRLFIGEGGTEDLNVFWVFTWIRLKGIYLIFGEHAFKWSRNLLKIKQPGFNL